MIRNKIIGNRSIWDGMIQGRFAFIGIMLVMFAMLSAAPAMSATSLSSNDMTVITASLVNQDPDPVMSGNFVDVRIGISNEGGQAMNNLIVEIVPAYPFSLVAGDTAIQNVGTINGYQGSNSDAKIVKYRLNVDKNAPAENYDLTVKTYEQGSASVSTKKFSISVSSQQSAEIIYIDQVELIPGKMTPMNFTIKNVGGSPLRDLTFQWSNSDDIVLPVGSDNTKYVSYIDVGQSVDIPFNVVASTTATPDLYKLDLRLSYNDQVTGSSSTITTSAGVYVGGATDFDVAFSGVSSNQYSFSIANIGSVSASSVTVRIPQQPGWTVSGSRASIIGNLNEGDYTIVSFSLQSMYTGQMLSNGNRTAGSPGQRPAVNTSQSSTASPSSIQVEIDYTDSRGNRNAIIKEVPLDASVGNSTRGAAFAGRSATQATTQASFWSKYGWYILIVVVLGVLLYVRTRVKHAKRDDPSYNYSQLLKDTFHGDKKKSKR